MIHPVWRMIDCFLEMYPDEEWGFAHIVLSDYALTDGNIDFCLNSSEPDTMPHSPITTAFLTFLKAVPEDERGIG